MPLLPLSPDLDNNSFFGGVVSALGLELFRSSGTGPRAEHADENIERVSRSHARAFRRGHTDHGEYRLLDNRQLAAGNGNGGKLTSGTHPLKPIYIKCTRIISYDVLTRMNPIQSC